MNVIAKAEALRAAWPSSAPPLTKNSVRLCLAQAEFETHCGDDWPNSHNWGAVQYRGCNAHELQAIQVGSLTDGMWLLPDGSWSPNHSDTSVAQLHTDTHPTASGPARYAVWFCAFPNDVAGAANYLKTALRMASTVLANPQATVEDFCTAVYLHGYFEGTHAGARPIKDRSIPLTPPESANVASYASGLYRMLTTIDPALAGWNLTDEDPGLQNLASVAIAQADVDLDETDHDPPPPPADA